MNIADWLAANVGKKIRFRWMFAGNAHRPHANAESDDVTSTSRDRELRMTDSLRRQLDQYIQFWRRDDDGAG